MKKYIFLPFTALFIACGTPPMKTTDDLATAAFYGKLDAVKKGVEAGININADTSPNPSPLNSSISGNQVEIVRYLVEKGADVNLETSENYPPLYYLCYSSGQNDTKKLAIAKILVNSGAKLNKKSNNLSLLQSCIDDEANPKIISYLKSAGARL